MLITITSNVYFSYCYLEFIICAQYLSLLRPMDNKAGKEDVDNINDRKCYSCGKIFRKPVELTSHKARKTPCLIRDLKPEDKLNPLRCIYCNTISSTKGNLGRHLAKCKIKNGGIDKLFDKVNHEEQIRLMQERERIMKEEHAQEIKNAEERIRVEFTGRFEEMEKKFLMLDSQKAQPVINGNVTVNNIQNNSIVNNYTEPNYQHLLVFEKFNSIFKEHYAGMLYALICELYFDPNHHENMSVHLVNKKTNEVIVMHEGSWKTLDTEEVVHKMRAVGYDIARQ